jgi:hypothetical protein
MTGTLRDVDVHHGWLGLQGAIPAFLASSRLSLCRVLRSV